MKKCTKCKQQKSFSEFYSNKTTKDGKQSYCKICLKESVRKDYINNNRKDIFEKRNKSKKLELKRILDEIKTYNGCYFCDEIEICCMDFHHVEETDKVANVSLLMNLKSKIKMLIEIQKCIVVCSNCHRKIHAGLLTVDKNNRCIIPNT